MVPALLALATAAAGFRRNIRFPPKNEEDDEEEEDPLHPKKKLLRYKKWVKKGLNYVLFFINKNEKCPV